MAATETIKAITAFSSFVDGSNNFEECYSSMYTHKHISTRPIVGSIINAEGINVAFAIKNATTMDEMA
ncbi:MAG: hypothetical protein QXX41_02735 [Nitrososphaerota archaeon]